MSATTAPVLPISREVRLEPWRYFLANSSDMTILTELRRASPKTLAVDMNQSGNVTFDYPMEAPKAEEIRPWRTCIIAQRGQRSQAEWFWSGPVSRVSRDYAEGKLSVNAIGWFEYLLRRLILERIRYQAGSAPRVGQPVHTGEWDDAEIVVDLLAYTNAQWNTHITPGVIEPSQVRVRNYEVDTNIGQEIQSLSDIESGYDWYIDPETRELNIVARRGSDKPNCKWLFIAGENPEDPRARSNLKGAIEEEEGTTLVNDIRARGKFSTGQRSSLKSQAFYDVLFQESASLSDVENSDILNAFAGAEILYRENPRITYSLTPKPHTFSGVPLLFRDYNLGDTTYLTLRRGKFSVTNQAVRIFGVSLSINTDGVETITSLKTAAD